MDKKNYLCKYHNLERRIEYLKKDIERCDELALSISGPVYDSDMPRSPNRNLEAPFVKWIYRRIDDEQELKRLEPEAEALKATIIDAISKIGDTELESVLIYRYIYWNSWNEISSKIYVSSTTARRLHTKALDAFKIPN